MMTLPISRLAAVVLMLATGLTLMLISPIAAGDIDILGIPDSWVHFAGHISVWAFVACIAAALLGKPGVISWIVAASLGCLEEWSQHFQPGRVVALDDFATNIISAGVATVLLILLIQLGRVRANQSESTTESPRNRASETVKTL